MFDVLVWLVGLSISAACFVLLYLLLNWVLYTVQVMKIEISCKKKANGL